MAKLNIKYVFLIQSFVGFLFGLGFMIIPNIILNLMGLDTPADIGEPIRFYGATIFATGILLFSIRKEPHSPIRQAIILMLIISHIPQLLFHLLFHPLDNFLVWNIIALNVIFISLYIYIFIKNRGK